MLRAKWSEFVLDAKTWVIPAERMKAGREHRVPVLPAVMALLEDLKTTDEFVFPGQTESKPLSNMAMEMCLRRTKMSHYTIHGLRSSFRDWVGEATLFQSDVAEMALAHIVGSATERAYRRGNAFDKRQELMMAWAAYCAGEHHVREQLAAADPNPDPTA
ncbi:tyrosine-type recombinase/integrase [Novosphingobium aquae]|uniref:Tyrosine-type recombinase/integrase n=1 Tax=Novosphingobium aquae TaxID=3133435 RepID=A0ABU8SAF5_9SPHN